MKAIQLFKTKMARLNIERVDLDGTLCITSKPRRSKEWRFALQDLEHLNKDGVVLITKEGVNQFCERLPSNIAVFRIPDCYNNFLDKTFLNKDMNVDWQKIPNKIKEKAFDFQKEDIKKGIQMGGKLFLSHEMGCGKSMISLGISSYYETATSKHLIICPSYLRYNWWREIDTWLGKDAQVIMKTKTELDLTKKFIVISYDLAVRKKQELNRIKWDTITCDESHYLKSRTSQRTKFLTPIIRRCSHVLLLSGTPALSRPSELYTQLAILYPRTFCSFTRFALRYCDYKKTHWGYDCSGSTNPDELSIIMDRVMIRRLKKNVLKDLPGKIRKEVNVPLSKKESKDLKEQFVKLRQMSDVLSKVVVPTSETRMLSFQRQALVSEMFRTTCAAKKKAVCEYVKGILQDNKQKIILFAHHQEMMNALEDVVSGLKEEYIRIDGKTNQANRQKYVDDFCDGSKRIAILSIMACNSGLNLTACSYIIFCELMWVPSILLQAEDRINRIGQKQACYYDYIVAQDSLDEKVFKKIHSKYDLLDHIIDKGQNTSGFNVHQTSEFKRALEDDEEESDAKKQKLEESFDCSTNKNSNA